MEKQVSAEDFVKTWQTSNSVSEVAEKLGRTPTSIITRAKKFRKRNIPLKFFERGTRALDIEALQKLAQETAQSA